MTGQIAVVQQLQPHFRILYHAESKSLLDDLFRAVDIGISLVEQIFPHGFPCKFRAKLKALDGTIPHRIQRVFLIIIQCLTQPLHSFLKIVIFFMQLIHQLYTILFNVCNKGGIHPVLHMDNIKFQQRGQVFAFHPKFCSVVWRHPVHGQIYVAVGAVVPSGP